MDSFKSLASIKEIAPLVCQMLSVEFPRTLNLQVLDQVGVIKKVDRLVLFAPDAIGVNVHQRFPEIFNRISEFVNLRIELQSVFPPKTPVCFASMFSGLDPFEHGITSYQKPVLSCLTMFDYLIAAQKKVAIVAVKNSSIDLIFRNRDLDYFSEDNDQAVLDTSLKLIEKNCYDLIVVYQQDYDDHLHSSGPYSKKAQEALKFHVDSFITLHNKLSSISSERWALMFCPDHGAHDNLQTGRGDHGELIAEDMHLYHYLKMNNF